MQCSRSRPWSTSGSVRTASPSPRNGSTKWRWICSASGSDLTATSCSPFPTASPGPTTCSARTTAKVSTSSSPAGRSASGPSSNRSTRTRGFRRPASRADAASRSCERCSPPERVRNIYLDIQTVQSRFASERGIPRYAVELTRALLKRGAPIEGIGLNPHLEFPNLPVEIAEAPQLTWNTAASFRRAQERGPMLFHMLSPFEMPPIEASSIPRAIVGSGAAVVASLYDVIPAVAQYHEPNSAAHRRYEARSWALRTADLLLALSESTRRDAEEYLDLSTDRIAVVGAAASDFFRPAEPGEDADALLRASLPALARPYVLTVTGWERRKNAEVLIQAFARLSPDVRAAHQLVMACRLTEPAIEAWQRCAQDARLGPDEIVFTDHVSDEVLRALYQQASLFAFTSLSAGFGL